MNNIQFMKICDSADNPFIKLRSFLLINPPFLNNIVKKLPFLDIFHDQKKIFICFDNLFQLTFSM